MADEEKQEEKQEEKKEEKKEEKAQGDEEEEKKDDEDEGEEEEESEADRLYNALKDPNSAREVITSLARSAGLKIDDAQDKKEAKNVILDSLEEHLGENYKFLAPKLGPAIEKILDSFRREQNERFAELKRTEIQRDTDRAVDELSKEYPDFKNHTKKIVTLMEEISPSDKLSQKEYLRRLYRIARSESSDRGGNNKGKDERAKKSRSDVSGRLTSSGGDDSKYKKSASAPSLRASIEEAYQEMMDNAE